MSERELTPRAAAKKLGLHWQTVVRMCDRGDLRAREVRGPIRRRLYIPVSEIDRWLDKLRWNVDAET